MSASAAALTPRLDAQGRVAFGGLELQVTLEALLCTVTSTQIYRNLEARPVEAVYTFPLPLRATLLDFSVTPGERLLQGTVVERTVAEARYEDAISDGHGAMSLRQLEDGLYSVSVGNLLPGEEARLRLRYALLQEWQGDTLRLCLPTTLAPRYGDPAAAGLEPHEVPGANLDASYGFSLTVVLTGLLAGATIRSPSHALGVESGVAGTLVSLAGGRAPMDRDLILELRLAERARDGALLDRDGDGCVACASFNPVFPPGAEPGPRHVQVLVDCSSSMNGDSIAQARVALERILARLRPQDYFNVVRFGSAVEPLFPTQVPADAVHLAGARRALAGMQADLDGTELGAALQGTFALPGTADLPRDVLLITDGEIWDVEALVELVQSAGHRLFTVGVGSAVGEGTVRRLAEASGGACELVSPREAMADRIERHFARMLSPPAHSARVHWPAAPTAQIPPALDTVYDGDTVHVFALFTEPPRGEVRLEWTLADGRVLSREVSLPVLPAATEGSGPGVLARVAAARALARETDPVAGTARALRYGLLSPWTGYLVVAEREAGARSVDLPALRPVPHMLAAGWGGACSVAGPPQCCLRMDDVDDRQTPPVMMSAVMSEPGAPAARTPVAAQRPGRMRALKARFLAWLGVAPAAVSLGTLVQVLNSGTASPTRSRGIRTLASLAALGVDRRLLAALERWIAAGHAEDLVVVTFLRALLAGPCAGALTRDARRTIRRAYRQLPGDPAGREALRAELQAAPELARLQAVPALPGAAVRRR